jgi:Domain of unknown function (DUF5655)
MTNAYHACEAYSLESHFVGKPPAIRALYDHLIKAMEPFGPVLVYPVKTRIIFQAETQFAVVIPHKSNLELHLWLQRRAQHPLMYKFQMGVYRDYGHMFRLTDPRDIDDDLISLLQEAYIIDSNSPLVPR